LFIFAAMEFLQVALEKISFTQRKGQRLAIVGETGSGKSNLLKIIAGLVTPTQGKIYFEGSSVPGPLERLIPGQPGIAYLSQHFELWSNYRVSEVLSYANDLSPGEADSLYRLCDIAHLLARRTDQLSGGERQRIALARLLVRPPRLLLLDEPFSNLDMIHKRSLKKTLHDSAVHFGISSILVSHDPLDILSWADEVLILRNGQLVQQGPPREVYTLPKDEYTAALLGDYTLADGRFLRPEAQTAFFFSTHP
jgi:ABC-type sulfate/molybdate transport systems ATPase subunit